MSDTSNHRYRLIAGEEGYYEASADVHLYDLLGYPLGDLDSLLPEDLSDTLVATAAWIVPALHRPEATDWLRGVHERPNAWLTPWRAGEPSIPADLWLDPKNAPGGSETSFLVARLDNPYVGGKSLRASLDAATSRFADLRRAIEADAGLGLRFPLERGTLAWLGSLQPDEPDEDLGLSHEGATVYRPSESNGAAEDS